MILAKIHMTSYGKTKVFTKEFHNCSHLGNWERKMNNSGCNVHGTEILKPIILIVYGFATLIKGNEYHMEWQDPDNGRIEWAQGNFEEANGQLIHSVFKCDGDIAYNVISTNKS